MEKKITCLSLSIVLIIFIVIGYITISSDNKVILKDTKSSTFKQNNNYLSMMLETSAGSSEYEKVSESTWPGDGYIFNATLSKCENGSGLTWDTTNNKIMVTGSKSDKCYVFFDIDPNAPKYWNNEFSFTEYAFPNTPNTTYVSIEKLNEGYSDFVNKPFYIKTTETEHQVCLYYNNNEFCMSNNYWDMDVETTIAKMRTDMSTALRLSESELSCNSNSNNASCEVSNLYCSATSVGAVACNNNNSRVCVVLGNGNAFCS